MPAPGAQHNSISNPFEESKPHISEYTAIEIATLQSRLEKQLGPEYLSSRSGPSGQKVHYITAEKCIALANEVFGFNGWSSSIQNIQVDFVDENPQTLKISLGLSVIVRVTLRDGTYHEDIGYGHMENCKGKAAAFEKAKKEGTTDALKRTLRNFGNVLGNCIYDKDYLGKVTKIKVAPTRFDADNLHRHSDFALKKEPEALAKVEVKSEPTAATDKSIGERAGAHVSSDTLDDDFGDFDMADFGVNEDGHPDEVVLPPSHRGGQASSSNPKSQSFSSATNSNDSNKSAPTNVVTKSMPPPPHAKPVGAPAQTPRQPQPPNQHSRTPATFQGRPNPQQSPRPPSHINNAAQQNAALHRTNTPPPHAPNPPHGLGPAITPTEPPPGAASFFSARSVKSLPEDAPPGTAVVVEQEAKVFNPHVESQTIRKTPGIDHRSSKPVSRTGQHVPPVRREPEEPSSMAVKSPGPATSALPPSVGAAAGRPNMGAGAVGNPALNQTRQIGAPGGPGSPLANRGGYRLTVKRPAPAMGPEGGHRAPLAEVSTNGVTTGPGATGVDAKRQKMA